MASSTAKRIALYTALFAGGSILACPPVGLGAAGIAVGTAVAALFGNTLASDIHAAFSRGTLNPLLNSQLQELVGRSLAVLIECYEREIHPPNTVQEWIPLLRRPDAELSALAKAARRHWIDLSISAINSALSDGEIHKAFGLNDRASAEPLISAAEWDCHLAELAMHAQTWFGDSIWLRESKRRPLAEYVAPRFAVAVRELVKADLSPDVGTGGRVFIALHLDLMRVISVSIRGIDVKSDEALKSIGSVQRQLGALSKLVVHSLSSGQRGDVFDLVDALEKEHQSTRALFDRRAAELRHQADIHEERSARRHDEVIAGIQQLLDRDKARVAPTPAEQASLPLPASERSPAEQAVLNQARQSADRLTRIKAALADRDFATVDALLSPEDFRRESQTTFELLTAQGDRRYFAGESDKAIEYYETALKLRPEDRRARNNVVIAHGSARLGDIAAHCRRAIEVATATLDLLPPSSTQWAGMQNNLGEAFRRMPSADPRENLGRAMEAYKAALTVYTREAHPVDWAGSQNNLGVVLATLPTGNRSEQIQKAIAAFEAALTVLTRDAHAGQWAATQLNLGSAWASLSTGDRAQHLRNAIAAYEAALTVYTRDSHPIEWAGAQNNLALARINLPTGERSDNVQKAISNCEAALTVFSRDRHPVQWAMTHNNLGSAWAGLATGDRAQHIRLAIAAFDTALTICTRSGHPVEWAGTQSNRAIVLAELSRLPGQDQCGALRQAIACRKAALTVYTPQAFPKDYAEIMRDLSLYSREYDSAGGAAAIPFNNTPRRNECDADQQLRRRRIAGGAPRLNLLSLLLALDRRQEQRREVEDRHGD